MRMTSYYRALIKGHQRLDRHNRLHLAGLRKARAIDREPRVLRDPRKSGPECAAHGRKFCRRCLNGS
jgi:hypothetical protein